MDVMAELATLRLLLDEALVELRSALAEVLPPPPVVVSQDPESTVDWSARLDELEQLLGQGSLEALDLIAELPVQCRAEAQVRYDLFRAQVETLDFAAALTTLPDLKEAL